MNLNEKILLDELSFQTSRSSGKGGQHVNKTESRVSVFFAVNNSQAIDSLQKKTLIEKLNLRAPDFMIQIDCEKSRSQLKNKKESIKKLFDLLALHLKPVKKRVPTKTPQAVKRKRLKVKKIRSEIKANRKKPI